MGETDHGIRQAIHGDQATQSAHQKFALGGVCNPSIWEVETGIRSSRPTSATGV